MKKTKAACLPDIPTLKQQLEETNVLKVEKLIFDGGRVKGVAYLGAIEVSKMEITLRMWYEYHVCMLKHTWQLRLQALFFGGVGEEKVDGFWHTVNVASK